MRIWSSIVAVGALGLSPLALAGDDSSTAQTPADRTKPPIEFIQKYCVECHGAPDGQGNLDLSAAVPSTVISNAETWERVVRKLRTRQMPPVDSVRPSEDEYAIATTHLTTQLDEAARTAPNPGRTETFRRLNRTEYQDAIRDLLDVQIDASTLLPADDASHGFDNVTVGTLSPTLLDRYISAAQKISRLAVGRTSGVPLGDTFRIPADLTQEDHLKGLPLGTRGGALISYTFPSAGEYEIQVRLARDRNEEIEGLTEPHEVEFLLDRARLALITVEPPKGIKDFNSVDARLKIRFHTAGGRHQVGVTFIKNSSSLFETKRQPYQARFNMHRHPRRSPAVYQISITGPFGEQPSVPSDTPSRRRLFVRQPAAADDEEECAREILSVLMRRAYRRTVRETDFVKPLELFRDAAREHGFDAGIESAVAAVLVNPHFLFRIELDPADAPAGAAYPVSNFELASRLSFFLWSSIPDDQLLDVAEKNQLRDPEVFRDQVKRMLADPRARSLATNFASQWLHLRNLDSFTPDLRLFPDFDDNLRQALRRETELSFERIVREDRSIVELLQADTTFVNERLAKHYGIPHVYGSRFRCIPTAKLPGEGDLRRGGLLRQGSVLSVTSYATRTSPVIRGKWILENLLGTPPPPPPANVPALSDNPIAAQLTLRERLAEHRSNPACASCHKVMDPVGFALENFDAIGRWREAEEGQPIDVSAGLPDGREFQGVDGLEQALVERPELFVTTFVEKLLTYALGRGIESHDGPAIRKIVRECRDSNYRFSDLVLGITSSVPFQMRKAE